MSVLSKVAFVNQAAALAGVGAWDLIEAKYNGCSFMTVKQPYESVDPTAGIQNAYANNTYTQNLFGSNANASIDPNSVLYATSMSLMSVNDNLKRKFVRFRNPGGTDVIQDFGWQGSSIQMEAIFSGQDYLRALNNFLTAAQNPQSLRLKTDYLTLEHPIYGTQNGVYLVDIKLSYSSAANSAVALTLTFECTTNVSISNSQLVKASKFDAIAKSFQQVEQSILGLSQSIGLLGALL